MTQKTPASERCSEFSGIEEIQEHRKKKPFDDNQITSVQFN